MARFYNEVVSFKSLSYLSWGVLSLGFSLQLCFGQQETPITTMAGSAGSASAWDGFWETARFNSPNGVSVDGGGNVYVADTVNHLIRSIRPNGVVTTIAGVAGVQGTTDGVGTDARFRYPACVTVDQNGVLFVTDQNNHTIRRISTGQSVTTFAGQSGILGAVNGTGLESRFNYPSGITLDSMGNIIIADRNNHAIRRITQEGIVTTYAGILGSGGNTNGASSSSRFLYPQGVAAGANGDVYVSDTFNHTIRKISSLMVVTTLAGSPRVEGALDGVGAEARFRYPNQLAVDLEGNVLVADQNNHAIRKITPTGVVSTIVGTLGVSGSVDGLGEESLLSSPGGVAIDSAGHLYIADYGSHTIRSSLSVSANTVAKVLPQAGPTVPELSGLDDAITGFMKARAFHTGTLALMKNSKLVYRQGFGWRDSQFTKKVHPDDKFRLASVSKTITSTAIKKLVDDGLLSYNQKIYPWLDIMPSGGVIGDQRISNITVSHLINHQAGWNSSVSPFNDPTFSTRDISSRLGISYPASSTDVIRFMLSQPLDYTPGSSSVYSNFGYQILGRVIEKASGKSFVDYLNEDLFSPCGIKVVVARSRLADRDLGEVWYDSLDSASSAVDFPADTVIRSVDGGLFWESFDSFVSVCSSAPDLCRFMQSYWVAGPRRLPNTPYGWGLLFYGSMPGASTSISQSVNQTASSVTGLEYAALFNKRTGLDDDPRPVILAAVSGISSWPTAGGGQVDWETSLLNVSETAGTIKVRLVRTGLASLPVKVSYATYSKSATSSNFVPSSAIIAFGLGELEKEVIIPILHDGQINTAREFTLELISSSGGAWLGERASCLVRILDADLRWTGDLAFTGGIFHGTLIGAAEQTVSVEFSTDLKSWQSLRTLRPEPNGRTVDIPITTPASKMFYRAFVQP